MSGEGDLSKIGVALTIIFAIALLALFAQLLYALRRRRRTVAGDGGEDRPGLYSSSDSSFSSKELLDFFCIRPRSGIESNSVTATSANGDLNVNRQLDMEGFDVDVFKVGGMLGPPRFLFTIKEDERDEIDSPAGKSLYAADKEAKKIEDINRNGGGSLEECCEAAEEPAVVLEIDELDATPFSTLCASPMYFTSSASPVHEVVDGPRSSLGKRRENYSSETITASFERPEV